MSRISLITIVVLAAAAVGVVLLPELVHAQVSAPTVSINLAGSNDVSDKEVYSGLKLTILITALVFLPSILMSTTCFARIAVVLAAVRQALGTAQTPPNQVIIGLALFLTLAVMGPVMNKMYVEGIKPFVDEEIDYEQAYERSFKPLRDFMLRHTREQDLALFLEVQKLEPPESPEDLGATTVIPAFMISELNSAFQIAFLVYLPFLILDMIISSILTSMSMITLPPTVISLPIKLMLFVVIDGWHLVIANLIKGYQV